MPASLPVDCLPVQAFWDCWQVCDSSPFCLLQLQGALIGVLLAVAWSWAAVVRLGEMRRQQVQTVGCLVKAEMKCTVIISPLPPPPSVSCQVRPLPMSGHPAPLCASYLSS